MPPYEKHVFVCVNRRDPSSGKGCCASKGSEQIRDRMKQAAAAAGLRGTVRVNAAGCLDQCSRGVAVVVYPEAVWYGGVTIDDVDEIVARHLVEGEPVERLRLPFARPAE